MRHYDRHQFRHLDDGERFRDHEYLADDGWARSSSTLRPELGGALRGTRGVSGRSATFSTEFPERGARRASASSSEVESWVAEGRTVEDRRFVEHEPGFEGSARGWWADRRGGPSAMLKAVASRLRRSRTALVTRVRDVIAVARHGGSVSSRSDRRIYDEVRERLARSSSLDTHDIDVTVREGVVLLDGFVRDRRCRYVAENVLEDVLGVRDVENRLRVRGTARGGF